MVLCAAGWLLATGVVLWVGRRAANWAAVGVYLVLVVLGRWDCALLAESGEWVIWVAFGWFACAVYFGGVVVLRETSLKLFEALRPHAAQEAR